MSKFVATGKFTPPQGPLSIVLAGTPAGVDHLMPEAIEYEGQTFYRGERIGAGIVYYRYPPLKAVCHA